MLPLKYISGAPPQGRTPALGLSDNASSKALDVPVNRITLILNGQRGVSADTALRLAKYIGTTPQVWLNLQKTWELRRAELRQAARSPNE